MNKDYVTVLDACVLVPTGLRDTLLRLAETPRLYIPKWSDEILEEVRRTLRVKLGKTEGLVGQLREAFPEADAGGLCRLEAGLTNHAKDRHVLAAAIRCSAQTNRDIQCAAFPRRITQAV